MSVLSVWSGLGARVGAPPPPPEADSDDFERPVVQRVVPAANTKPPANAFQLAFASAPAPTEVPAAITEEKPTMPKQAAGTQGGKTILFMICEQLAGVPSRTRTELAKLLPTLDSRQLGQGLFQANSLSRIERCLNAASEQAWRITAGGKRYLQEKAGAVAAEPKRTRTAPKAKPPKAPTKPAKAARRAPTPAPAAQLVVRSEVVAAPSFRCAVDSNGGFMVAKNGQQIELEVDEFRHMCHYLDRMAGGADNVVTSA